MLARRIANACRNVSTTKSFSGMPQITPTLATSRATGMTGTNGGKLKIKLRSEVILPRVSWLGLTSRS